MRNYLIYVSIVFIVNCYPDIKDEKLIYEIKQISDIQKIFIRIKDSLKINELQQSDFKSYNKINKALKLKLADFPDEYIKITADFHRIFFDSTSSVMLLAPLVKRNEVILKFPNLHFKKRLVKTYNLIKNQISLAHHLEKRADIKPRLKDLSNPITIPDSLISVKSILTCFYNSQPFLSQKHGFTLISYKNRYNYCQSLLNESMKISLYHLHNYSDPNVLANFLNLELYQRDRINLDSSKLKLQELNLWANHKSIYEKVIAIIDFNINNYQTINSLSLDSIDMITDTQERSKSFHLKLLLNKNESSYTSIASKLLINVEPFEIFPQCLGASFEFSEYYYGCYFGYILSLIPEKFHENFIESQLSLNQHYLPDACYPEYTIPKKSKFFSSEKVNEEEACDGNNSPYRNDLY
ncbi:MAG: hypothetical protein OCC49_18340 [Fibrobacterales bacterium]